MDYEKVRNTPIHQLLCMVDDFDIRRISERARQMIDGQLPELPDEGRRLGEVPEVVKNLLYLGAEVYLADMDQMNEIIGCDSDCTREELSGYVQLMDAGQFDQSQRFSTVVKCRQAAFRAVITSTLRSSFFDEILSVEDVMITKGFLVYAIPGISQSGTPFIIEGSEDFE